jgi:glycerophosphoryl diester phosphodiesterase
MRITTSVDASRVQIGKVDAVVLRLGPDGRIVPVLTERDWVVADRPPAEVVTLRLTGMDVGVFDWLFVLCYPGHDPVKPESWAAAAGTEVFVLPVGAALRPATQESFYAAHPNPPVLIAHGGGEYREQIVTNTREALDYNYARGHRYFEVDVCWTSDGHPVLIHDWQHTYKTLFADTGGIPTLKEFESRRMKAGTAQLSLGSLYQWLQLHTDAVIVTDVKERNVAALTRIAHTAGGLKQRFIPQIYAPTEFEPVQALGFARIILTLYRVDMNEPQVLAFVREHKVYALTLSARKAFAFTDLRKLKREGMRLYVHTINQPQVLHYFRHLGADGVYTDRIVP